MGDRFHEKQNYIKNRLEEIQKAFKCTSHQKEFNFKWYETICNFNIIAEVEIIGIKTEMFYFHPDDHIKTMDKKFKEISSFILI